MNITTKYLKHPELRYAFISLLQLMANIAELAHFVKRDYKNVHNDVERLMEWLAIEKNGKNYSIQH